MVKQKRFDPSGLGRFCFPLTLIVRYAATALENDISNTEGPTRVFDFGSSYPFAVCRSIGLQCRTRANLIAVSLVHPSPLSTLVNVFGCKSAFSASSDYRLIPTSCMNRFTFSLSITKVSVIGDSSFRNRVYHIIL